MASQEVNKLRKEGKLEEALVMAQQDMENDSQNIWNKRAIAWVYYEYAKKLAKSDNQEEFLDTLKNIAELQLDKTESLLYNSLCWPIYTFLTNIKQEQGNSRLDSLFELIREIDFDKPSLNYTILLKGFYKHREHWSNFIDFCNWWGFENFREEDYLKEKLPDGKEMPLSVCEEVYIAYAKRLLQKRENSVIKEFMPKLDVLIETHPEMVYPGYYKGKLMIATGDKTNLLNTLVSFVKKKRNDFWAWLLMAEALLEDETKNLACLYRAVNCKTPEKFLTKARQDLAKTLIAQKFYNEAKFQIDKVVETKQKEESRIPDQIHIWMNSLWYKNAQGTATPVIGNYMEITNQLLMGDIEECIIVVDYVNQEKKIANFVYAKEKKGFFKYERLINEIRVGDVLKVRFKDNIGDTGHTSVLTLRKSDELPNNSFYKIIQDALNINPINKTGKVQQIFIPAYFIESKKIKENTKVKATAVYCYNVKKNEWSWKCVDITLAS